MDVVLILGAVVGIATLAYAALRGAGASPLRKLRIVAIADAPERQPIRVRGTVVAPEPLTAPYTGRKCVYYKLVFSQIRFEERADLVLVDRCDFEVRDDTGVARVLSERAEFEVVPDMAELERASRLSERARAIAKKHGWGLADVAQVDIREAVVVVGESIDVAGRAVRTPNPEAGAEERQYRDAPPTIPVFSAETTVLGEAREPVWVEPLPADG